MATTTKRYQRDGGRRRRQQQQPPREETSFQPGRGACSHQRRQRGGTQRLLAAGSTGQEEAARGGKEEEDDDERRRLRGIRGRIDVGLSVSREPPRIPETHLPVSERQPQDRLEPTANQVAERPGARQACHERETLGLDRPRDEEHHVE